MEQILLYTMNCLVSFIEIWLLYKVIAINCQLTEYGKMKICLIPYLISSVFFVAILNEYEIAPLGTILFIGASLFFYGKIALKGNKKYAIFVSVIYLMMLVVVDFGCAFFINFVYENQFHTTYLYAIRTNVYPRVFGMIVTKTVLYVIVTAYLRLKGRKQEKKKIEITDIELFIPVISTILLLILVSIFSFTQFEAMDYYMIMIICAIVVILWNYIVVNLIRKINQSQEEKRQYMLEAQYQNMVQKHLEENQNIYSALKEMRHDMQHHMKYIQFLIEEERYEEIRKYFGNIDHSLILNDNIFITGNEVIDVVLSQKNTVAKGKGIHIQIDIQSIDLHYIQDTDLCSALSNLLDNAIEAVEICTEKEISLKIVKNKNWLIINEENTCQNIKLNQNEKLYSTKKDKEMHGFGMRSMQRIADKYHGSLQYRYENNKFFIKLILLDEMME